MACAGGANASRARIRFTVRNGRRVLFKSAEWTQSAWPTIKNYLAPALLKGEVESGRDCAALFARVRGHRMSKAGLENAVWDAEARQKQQPLWKLLGGSRREIACGV